jgi:hypothetical protein
LQSTKLSTGLLGATLQMSWRQLIRCHRFFFDLTFISLQILIIQFFPLWKESSIYYLHSINQSIKIIVFF